MKLHKSIHFRTKADSFRKNYRKKKGAYELASNVLHSGLAPPKRFPSIFHLVFNNDAPIIKSSLFLEDITVFAISLILNEITVH